MPPPEPPPPPVVSPAAPPPPGYVSKLYAHLAEYKHYPRASLQAHIQGTVIVRFTIDRDGRVAAKSIVTGSGHADLDAEALATLDRAQPLPAPPPEMTAPRELVVPIQFSVK
jgi:protein TonB